MAWRIVGNIKGKPGPPGPPGGGGGGSLVPIFGTEVDDLRLQFAFEGLTGNASRVAAARTAASPYYEIIDPFSDGSTKLRFKHTVPVLYSMTKVNLRAENATGSTVGDDPNFLHVGTDFVNLLFYEGVAAPAMYYEGTLSDFNYEYTVIPQELTAAFLHHDAAGPGAVWITPGTVLELDRMPGSDMATCYLDVTLQPLMKYLG